MKTKKTTSVPVPPVVPAPAPVPPAPVTPADPKAAAAAAKHAAQLAQVITVLVANPKKVGSKSFKRFELYKTGQTVGAFLKAGGRIGDIRWDVRREYIRVQ